MSAGLLCRWTISLYDDDDDDDDDFGGGVCSPRLQRSKMSAFKLH